MNSTTTILWNLACSEGLLVQPSSVLVSRYFSQALGLLSFYMVKSVVHRNAYHTCCVALGLLRRGGFDLIGPLVSGEVIANTILLKARDQMSGGHLHKLSNCTMRRFMH
jgi:hypothetical protein